VTDARVKLGETSEKTSSTLLIRVKSKDQEAWRRFLHLYGPLVTTWCRRYGVPDSDAADVGQEIFRTVAESIDGFHHDQKGDSLRGWLRTITRTRVLDFHRRNARSAGGVGGSEAQARLLELPDGHHTHSEATEKEDENLLARRAVEMVLENCKEETRQAFLRVVVEGHHPVDVARDLGITTNAVYLAKSHTLRRIRQEFAQLVDI
jgi:RNA polymerase sigma-70 factor, ECF subfamily